MDDYGNSYIAGLSLGENNSAQIQLIPAALSSSGATVLQFPLNLGDELSPSTVMVSTFNSGASNQTPYLSVSGPVNSNDTSGETFQAQFAAASDDSTIPCQLIIADVNGIPYLALSNSGPNIQGIIGGGFSSSGVTAQSFFIPFTLNGALLSYGASAGGQVVKTFTSSGTWTCPTGVTTVKAEAWAGGGGGGGGSAPTTSGNGGCGGGGGEYAAEATLAVTPGHTYSFSVGFGGSPGAAGTPTGAPGGTGGNAGNTSFPGDSVTLTAHGGGGGIGGHNGHVAGSGGTGSTNSVHHNGGDGGIAASSGTDTGGGGGGSAASASSAGHTGGSSSGRTPATGGSSAGSGSGSGGTGGWGSNSNNGTNGGSGGSYGGGGAGGGGGTDAHTHGGGRGGAGAVKLTYTLPGSTAIAASLSSASGTDTGGNAYPAGYQGPVIAVQPGSSPSSPETWHAVPLTSGWTNISGRSALSVKKLAETNSAWIIGEIQSPSGGFSNPNTVGTISNSAYWPTHEQPITVRFQSGTDTSPPAVGWLRAIVTSSGQVQIFGSNSTSQAGFQIYGQYSLDL
jgi:hypothetical protein